MADVVRLVLEDRKMPLPEPDEPVDARAVAPRVTFWSFNAGQLGIIIALLGFGGTILAGVNGVEKTLDNHETRISSIERENGVHRLENAARLDAMSKSSADHFDILSGAVGSLARELSVIQGQLMQQQQIPGKRGDVTNFPSEKDGGG